MHRHSLDDSLFEVHRPLLVDSYDIRVGSEYGLRVSIQGGRRRGMGRLGPGISSFFFLDAHFSFLVAVCFLLLSPSLSLYVLWWFMFHSSKITMKYKANSHLRRVNNSLACSWSMSDSLNKYDKMARRQSWKVNERKRVWLFISSSPPSPLCPFLVCHCK